MTSNQIFTYAKTRGALSAGPGIAYDNTTGIISFAGMSRFVNYGDFTLINNETRAQWDEVNTATTSTLPGLRLDQVQVLPAAAEVVRIKVPLFTQYNPNATVTPAAAVTVFFPYRVNQTALTAAPTVTVYQETFGPMAIGPQPITSAVVTSTTTGNVATATAANQFQFMQTLFNTAALASLGTARYMMEVSFSDAASPTSQPSIYGAYVRM